MRGKQSLSHRIGEIATLLLGEPNGRLSTRAQFRFGSNGSIAVEIAGARAGTWFDHENEIGGGIWDLLRVKGGMDKAAAGRWLRDKFGIEIEEQRGRSAGRVIAATYDYVDEQGTLIFQVVRFEPKDFRQRRPGSDGQWVWNIRGIRPVLYRLTELIAAPPESRVYIAEGEKDVDNLRHLGVIATTNPGGAAKPGNRGKWRAEFARHLAGFNVVIILDNDDAGRAHANMIAASIAGAAASVRILQLPGLATKGDVSDWIAAGGTRDQLEALAAGIAPLALPSMQPAAAASERPADNAQQDATAAILVRQFEQRPDGLWWQPSDGNKSPVHVCGPLTALARTRDDRGENWGVLLTWHDGDGRLHEWAMPRAMLAGDGVAIREYLLDRGLYVAPDQAARHALLRFLTAIVPEATARCVARVGWHRIGNHEVFALPDAVYGDAPERVLLQSAGAVEHKFNQLGSLAEWQGAIGRYCVGNTRLLLAVSAAFAGPLLMLTGEQSGGINFKGSSQIGKTTALRVAGSVWGGSNEPLGYMRQWRATANGLEGTAAAHCDALLGLDELGQIDPREAGDVAYMLANGAGKGRAGREGNARPVLSWRIFILSTGETSLADLVQEAGRRAKAGQEVRLVDVPADLENGLGIFDELHDMPSADVLVRTLRDATMRFYGTPIRAFLSALTTNLAGNRDALLRGLQEQRRAFVDRHVPTEAAGQVLPVAGRFALVAAAGELATRYGVTGWKAGDAEWGVGLCFRAWLDRRGGTGMREEETGIAQIRAFIEQHGSSRFEIWGAAPEQRIISRAGFRRTDENGAWEYYVMTEAWRQEVCNGHDPSQIAKALAKRGLLMPGSDDKSRGRLRYPATRK
jgi:putative DNA primase/helicase